jgi:Sulfotransferase family
VPFESVSLRKLVRQVEDKLFAIRYHTLKRKSLPIFIVGCGHSGTSVLLAMLGTHSKIHAIPYETYFALKLQNSDPRTIVDNANKRFGEMTVKARKLRWVEKTPSHILYLAEVFKIYPQCKVLMVIRDGRDVACSIQDRTGSLEEGIIRWVTDNKAGQQFWPDPRVHTVRYEQMVEHLEASLRAIMKFLGEQFEERMLHYHETPKLYYANVIEKPDSPFGDKHEQYRNWQINQPFFDGRGKWKRLTESEKDLIKNIAGDMLIEYGYVKDSSW